MELFVKHVQLHFQEVQNTVNLLDYFPDDVFFKLPEISTIEINKNKKTRNLVNK